MSKEKINTRTREESKKLMWEYYLENKSTLPKWIKECREEILDKIQIGLDVGSVFSSITENVDYVES